MKARKPYSLCRQLVPLVLFALSTLAVSCGTLEVGIERAATPDPSVTTGMAAVAADNTHLATQVATLGISPTLTSALNSVDLPRLLYFLPTDPGSSEGPSGVWRFDPRNAQVERITPPDLWIMSFDIWLGDGRIAYGTRNGQLFIVMPDQEPRLLHDAGLQADDDVWIDGVAWSPEGTRLAYSVRYISGIGPLGQSDGLWLLALNSEAPIKLLGNRHLEADLGNVNDVRSISDPVWSPDGAALILTGHYWEWTDTLWLDPVAPDPSEANLHDVSDELWITGSWAGDSQSILFSGTDYSTFSDLVQVRRDSNYSKQLLAGETEGLFIYNAQELSEGIAFLAYHNPQETQLYFGNQTENGFIYAPAGPNRFLCTPGYVRDITWDPTGRLATLSCSQGVQIVSLDGTVDVDLTPFLGPLIGEDHLRIFWGPSREND